MLQRGFNLLIVRVEHEHFVEAGYREKEMNGSDPLYAWNLEPTF